MAACSIALIALGVLAFDVSMRLSRGATDPDAIEMLGFGLMLLIGGAGIALTIASVCVALFRFRDR